MKIKMLGVLTLEEYSRFVSMSIVPFTIFFYSKKVEFDKKDLM